MLNRYFQKISLPDSLKFQVPEEITFLLATYGFPAHNIMGEYDMITPYIDSDRLILGTHTRGREHLVYIDLKLGSVCHLWNYSPSMVVFLNSSLLKFILCSLTESCVMSSLIQSESMGEFAKNAAKYSDFQRSLLSEIDAQCVEIGAWRDHLEERSYGMY